MTLRAESPKAYEAILVGALPIFHRSNVAYSILAAEGWPLIGVSTWEEVTPAAMHRWWHSTVANNLPCAKSCMRLGVIYKMLLHGTTMAECCREQQRHAHGEESTL